MSSALPREPLAAARGHPYLTHGGALSFATRCQSPVGRPGAASPGPHQCPIPSSGFALPTRLPLGRKLQGDLLKTRTDLLGAIEMIDAAMLRAANESSDTPQHWNAWKLALSGMPQMDEVPSDLGHWWQNQLLDASRRAFENKELRRRYHNGDFDAGGLSSEGVVWNNGPCAYRGREIRVELRRETLGASWTAAVTISNRHELRITTRMFFAGLPSSVMGAIGAYALVLEEARQNIDRMDTPII